MPKECRTTTKPPLNAIDAFAIDTHAETANITRVGRGMDTFSRRKELREAGQKGAVAFRFGDFAFV